MAAAHGHLVDGADDADGEGTPLVFRHAVAGLRDARLRPELEIDSTPPPRRLAPFSYALEAAVVVDDEELAEGRLILLHDPAGHDAWHGSFRMVTLVHADLEPEMAADPLLPEVCWTWLTGALAARGVAYAEPSGTVTRAGSHYFGGLADRAPSTKIEIRASWTPTEAGDPDRRGGPSPVPDTAAHLSAWGDLLCQVAGLPPVGAGDPSVVTLPQRRGPLSR
ncbi:DUF3000 domain-containing protein [Streptomyces buecherae]|uniref:DUF3000 domain-containing protein n=1 Tax=Streptomyces buecherae TaxID=2763006 RepID=UPI0033EA40D5